MDVMRGGNHASDLAALFESLPLHNQELLKYLAAFIAKLIPYAGATKMELVQFCTVFVSSLSCGRRGRANAMVETGAGAKSASADGHCGCDEEQRGRAGVCGAVAAMVDGRSRGTAAGDADACAIGEDARIRVRRMRRSP